jgi:hypothetical protein
MTQPQNTRLVTAIAATVLLAVVATVSGQKLSPADVAAKLSGNWKLNRELSSGVGGPNRGGSGGGAPGRAAFALAGGALSGQRGGGGGRGGAGGGGETSMPGDLPPDVVAAQAAIRDLQQIPESLAIRAAADTITFTDPRGERTFAIGNKTAKLEVNSARVDVKSRWDKSALRQEFTTAQTRLVRSWEADEQGHLVLKARIESMTTNSKEVKAVYDKQ